MPWSETSPMDQRTQFIADYLREMLSVTELCELYGISRKTGYKWIDRYLHQGPAGLQEHSRKPQRSPNETAPEIVDAILNARSRHPSWGAKKLLTLLHKRYPRWSLPGRSTVCDILSRHGLVPKKPRRRHIGHPGKPTTQILAPNDVWSADFKGQFKTGDGVYCYPLTVTDGFNRYLLGCQALSSTAAAGAKPVFARLFQEYGLPKRIRTDNGVPLRHQYLGQALQSVGVVGEVGHPSRIDRTRQAATKWPTRTDAPHPQGRSHASTGGQPRGSATQVQPLPSGI